MQQHHILSLRLEEVYQVVPMCVRNLVTNVRSKPHGGVLLMEAMIGPLEEILIVTYVGSRQSTHYQPNFREVMGIERVFSQHLKL